MTAELSWAVFGLCGLAAGFLSGLFGIGGGLIIVPVLVYAFTAAGVPTQHVVQMALATSMAAILVSAAQSALAHVRRGSAYPPMALHVAPWVMVGVVAGSALATGVAPTALLIFVGCFQFVAAILMVTDVSRFHLLRIVARRQVALKACSVAFGGIAALAGIGGGTLFTPYFTAGGMPPRRAIGTSAVIGVPVSLAGALAYAWQGRSAHLGPWTLGYIHLPALAALVLGALVTVRFGVALAHRLPPRMLSAGFAVFLVANGAHLLYIATS